MYKFHLYVKLHWDMVWHHCTEVEFQRSVADARFWFAHQWRHSGNQFRDCCLRVYMIYDFILKTWRWWHQWWEKCLRTTTMSGKFCRCSVKSLYVIAGPSPWVCYHLCRVNISCYSWFMFRGQIISFVLIQNLACYSVTLNMFITMKTWITFIIQ